MADNRLVKDLTVDEFISECKNVPRSFFLDACREVCQGEIQRVGEELTGKDLTDPKDRLCVRRTFDKAQADRLESENVRHNVIRAVSTEGVKLLLAVVMALVCSSVFLK